MKDKVKVSEHEYRYIGKHGNRAEADELVSGKRQFLDDLIIPGMLTVKVLRSPYPNCLIKTIDLEKAKALPGVVGVCSYKEAPDWKCGLPNHRRVLDSHMRFTGDSVALVAAETPEIADEALRLIDVTYEELPFVLDCEEALKPDAPQLYEEYPGNEIPKTTPFSEEPFNQIFTGNVEQAFKKSKYVQEGYMRYENMAHPLPPESPGCIASWTSEHAVTVWYNGGAPHLQKFNTEASIPGVAVRVIACQSGGSYGSKQLIPHMILQAVLMSKITGRPCKFIMDRNEHMLTYELRQGSRIRGRIGMTEDGIINAVEGMWYTDSGMSSTYAQAMTAVGLGECQAFLGKCRDWALDTKLVATNHSSQAPIRGFGGQECKSVLVP
ncbi:MAG: xanthine dehydrogenase family protein molybdopterin-binding subunit, partial [Lachnospiraceae bacterium]|nr:xanthine dehydrogenase family protein molybdopterin-binding subunit [Lachnospiraceae bacterium]